MADGTEKLRSDGDIQAIDMLTKDIQTISGIKDPPLEYNVIVKYRGQTDEVLKKAMETAIEVNDYAERINRKNEDLKVALRENDKRVHEAMMKLVDKLRPHEHTRPKTTTPREKTSDNIRASTVKETLSVLKENTSTSPVKLSIEKERPRQSGLEMKCLNELLKMKEMSNKLEQAVTQTQIVVDKMQNNVNLTNQDFDTLREKIKDLQSTEQREIEKERRRKEEEERRRKADEEKRRREQQQKREEERQRQREEAEERRQEELRRREQEKERKRREDEEKRMREQEERERRERERQKKLEEEKERRRLEAEEKRKLEEQERLRQLEEERLQREAGERRKIEEEERRRKEEKERRRREEEERKKREEEARQKRLEEEAQRKREEEERLAAEQRESEIRRRLDPNNWEPITYTRNEAVDDVSSTSHHRGVCCVVTAIQDAISEDDLQCLASDDADDIIDALEDGDKVVSSVVSINSRKDKIILEAPMRAYLPCQSLTNASEEISMKMSVDGSDWVVVTPLESPAGSLVQKKVRLMGVELNDFEEVKIVAVARERGQNITVNKTGTCTRSSSHKHVQLFVPRDAFNEPTELKLSVKSIPDDILQTIESGSDFIGTIIKGGPLVTLDTPTAPMKQIEVDIMTSSDSVRSQTHYKGKTYALVKSKNGAWQFADIEYKSKGKDRSVSLPLAKIPTDTTENSALTSSGGIIVLKHNDYALTCWFLAKPLTANLLEMEVTPSTSSDDVMKRAGAMYDCMTRSVVRVIVKQKDLNPEQIIIHCVGRDVVFSRLKELDEMGYSTGPDTSREFYIADGQRLKISCSGNIEFSLEEGWQHLVVPFFAYMDTAKLELIVNVKDEYKQKDLPEYMGNIHCKVLPPNVATDDNGATCEVDIQLPVSLPKGARTPLHLKTAPVRLPHYWSALATFLSWKLTDNYVRERGIDWHSVLSELTGDKHKMNRLLSRAKTKNLDAGEMELCHAMLEDWMKSTNVYDDKVGPVVDALEKHDLTLLGQHCVQLVQYHRDNMSDAIMREWAEKLSSDIQELAVKLHVAPSVVDACVAESLDVNNQVTSLLMEWRSSLAAIEMGTSAIGFLRSL